MLLPPVGKSTKSWEVKQVLRFQSLTNVKYRVPQSLTNVKYRVPKDISENLLIHANEKEKMEDKNLHLSKSAFAAQASIYSMLFSTHHSKDDFLISIDGSSSPNKLKPSVSSIP